VSDSNALVNPGITISFSEEFWNSLLKGIIPGILRTLQTSIFEGGTLEIKVKELLTIYGTSYGYVLHSFSYDDELTYVNLLSENNSIGIHIINSTLNASASYAFDIDPPIATDNGTMNFAFSGLDINTVFKIGNSEDPKNVDVQVQYSEMVLSSNKTELTLNNTNDFNQMSIFIFNTIKPALIGVLTRAFGEYLEEGINAAIHAVPDPIVINDGLDFDISLIQASKVNENFTINQLVGRFFRTNSTDLPFENNDTIPNWKEGGGTLQLYISEYTIQTYFYEQYKLKNLELMIEESPNERLLKFDVNSFSYFVPPLAKLYAKDQKTRLWLKAKEEYPRINITTSNVILSGVFHVGIDVEVGDGQWETSVVWSSDARFDGNLQITGELLLTPTVNNIVFKIKEIVETNLEFVNTNMIDTILLLIETILKIIINFTFSGGISLTSFLPIEIDFNLGEYDFSLYDGYMQLWASPDYQNTDTNMKFIDHIVDILVFRTKPILTSDNSEIQLPSYGSLFKKYLVKEASRTNFKKLFGRHQLPAIRSTYKGYKFLEGILNLGNPDYDSEHMADL
jgi:hypothetical protein